MPQTQDHPHVSTETQDYAHVSNASNSGPSSCKYWLSAMLVLPKFEAMLTSIFLHILVCICSNIHTLLQHSICKSWLYAYLSTTSSINFHNVVHFLLKLSKVHTKDVTQVTTKAKKVNNCYLLYPVHCNVEIETNEK